MDLHAFYKKITSLLISAVFLFLIMLMYFYPVENVPLAETLININLTSNLLHIWVYEYYNYCFYYYYYYYYL